MAYEFDDTELERLKACVMAIEDHIRGEYLPKIEIAPESFHRISVEAKLKSVALDGVDCALRIYSTGLVAFEVPGETLYLQHNDWGSENIYRKIDRSMRTAESALLLVQGWPEFKAALEERIAAISFDPKVRVRKILDDFEV